MFKLIINYIRLKHISRKYQITHKNFFGYINLVAKYGMTQVERSIEACERYNPEYLLRRN